MSNEKEQVEIAERLQVLWLKRMESLLESGEITSTDLATLARVLLSNGWNLDPSKLPERLRQKLTESVAFDDDDESGGVIPIRRHA
jgi:hypothetical protein